VSAIASAPPRAPSDVAARRRRRAEARRHAAWRRRRLVALLMAPWIVGFAVFFVYPLVTSAYLSFTHYDLLSSPRWVGFANYDFLLHKDALVWPAVRNTLWLIGIAVPLQLLFAFGIAQMLARARRGIGIWRTIFYLPALAPPVAATIGFVYLLNPATGPVNTLLAKVGIHGPLWFDSPTWSKPSLTLLGIWGIGNTMLIFLAALVDVPRHLLEAAELEGAGWWSRLRWVTLPSISPVILFALVIGVIEALQYFDQAYVASTIAAGSAGQAADSARHLGEPQGSTLFYPVLLYQQGFRFFNMGYASAMAMLLFVVALAVTFVLIRNTARWVHHQGPGR
jgi:multiple sugar transport system permease protein